MTFASGLVLHYKERIAERQSQLASAEAGDARLLELRGALQEAGQIGQQKDHLHVHTYHIYIYTHIISIFMIIVSYNVYS